MWLSIKRWYFLEFNDSTIFMSNLITRTRFQTEHLKSQIINSHFRVQSQKTSCPVKYQLKTGKQRGNFTSCPQVCVVRVRLIWEVKILSANARRAIYIQTIRDQHTHAIPGLIHAHILFPQNSQAHHKGLLHPSEMEMVRENWLPQDFRKFQSHAGFWSLLCTFLQACVWFQLTSLWNWIIHKSGFQKVNSITVTWACSERLSHHLHGLWNGLFSTVLLSEYKLPKRDTEGISNILGVLLTETHVHFASLQHERTTEPGFLWMGNISKRGEW